MRPAADAGDAQQLLPARRILFGSGLLFGQAGEAVGEPDHGIEANDHRL